MIIVRVMGGLGNQMFQYAFYRALCAQGKDARLDTSWFEQFQAHNGYELERLFAVKPQMAPYAACEALGEMKMDILHRMVRKFYTKKTYYAQTAKAGICYDEKILAIDNMYLSGYWQSEQYFLAIAKTVREDFSFKLPMDEKNIAYMQAIAGSNSVSLHVRRGDYLNNAVHGGICSVDYYQKAIRFMEAQIDNPCFFVFSDDISWCKEHLSIPQAIYVTGNNGTDSYNDMRLMSLCKHNIIANSSFSWWGAWLNTHADKVVIAPEKWFNIKNVTTKDLLPKDWVKISV